MVHTVGFKICIQFVFLSVISFMATLVYFTPVRALLTRNEALSGRPPPPSALLIPPVLEVPRSGGIVFSVVTPEGLFRGQWLGQRGLFQPDPSVVDRHVPNEQQRYTQHFQSPMPQRAWGKGRKNRRAGMCWKSPPGTRDTSQNLFRG